MLPEDSAQVGKTYVSKLIASAVAGATLGVLAGFISYSVGKYGGLLNFSQWLWNPSYDSFYLALFGGIAGTALFIAFGKQTRA